MSIDVDPGRLRPLLQRAIESMRESVMITDTNLSAPGPTILFVNRAFCELTGHQTEDILGQSPRILQGPDTDRDTLARLKRQLSEGKTFEGRAINYRRDGTPFVLQWYIEPILDEHGGTTHFLAVQRDVSEEEERNLSLRHLNAAFQHTEEAIVVLSASGTIQYDNEVASRMFDGRIPLPFEAWEQLREGVPWEGILEASVGDETRRMSTRVRPVPSIYPGEQNYVLTASDVTDVERLETIASSVNLSDNIGHFLSGIRHELGNPVNSIKTALTVLRGNISTFHETKVDEYLGQVLDEVGRIEHLLRSLRSFTAYESIQLEQVELEQIFTKIAAIVRPSIIRAGVGFELRPVPPGVLTVDVRALYQVFINLISNALEAVEGLGGARVTIEFETRSNHIDVMIIDNGAGISDSQIRRVVQPFYTTKRTGTGLGLSIVERLLSAHDGSLRLLSETEGGTRAVVTLPFTEPAKQRVRA